MIKIDKKKYFYDTFAERFDSEMNKYELNKRLSIIFEKLLCSDELTGIRL